MDKVSVILTSYNRVNLLKRAIDSVLKQTYSNFELIIIDDCSEPPTQKVLDEYLNDTRITIFRMKKNVGANVCRNKGLSLATGKFYTGLDDDDFFLPKRLNTLCSSFEDDYSFVCDNYLIDDGQKLKRRFAKGMKYLNADKLAKVNQAGNQVFTYLERIKEIGGFDETLKRLQDQDTWYRLALRFGQFKRIDDATYIMDVSHEINRITKMNKEYDAYNAFYKKHKAKMSSSASAYNKLRLSYLENKQLSIYKYDFDNLVLYFKFIVKMFLARRTFRGNDE